MCLSYLLETLNQDNRLKVLIKTVALFSTTKITRKRACTCINSGLCCCLFQLVRDLEVAHAEGQTSTDWLENHSLVAQELTLKDVLKEGIPVK